MTKRPRPPHHNHTTRDIKKPGICPACDSYHVKDGGFSVDSARVEARHAAYAGYQRHIEHGSGATLAGALNAALEAAAPIIAAQAKAEALSAFADAHRMPEPMFMDNGRVVTVGDLIREQAAAYSTAAGDSNGPIVSPDCRDLNHQKCTGDAWDEAHDHITECQCSCHAETVYASGFMGRDTTGLLPAHTCTRPGPGYPLGVIWQCLDCKKTYRMESVRDRGISQDEWAPYEATP